MEHSEVFSECWRDNEIEEKNLSVFFFVYFSVSFYT